MTEAIFWLAVALAAAIIALPFLARLARTLAERRWWRASAGWRRVGLDLIAATDTRRRWR